MSDDFDPRAFPTLDAAEMKLLEPHTSCKSYKDGQYVYRAGEPNMGMFIVKSGAIDILNPRDDNQKIASHGPGQFSGDIDLLTGRPIVVNGVARGPTDVWLVPGGKEFRKLLNNVPQLSEKILEAMQVRRAMLEAKGVVGVRVIGPANCPDTNTIREFLYKNFVPNLWVDSDSAAGKEEVAKLPPDKGFPRLDYGNGRVKSRPSLHEVAERTGVWQGCPDDTVDLAIVGAGPAGLAAAVYAASEGLNTIVLDSLGPGGQAGASSRIENFIGFPSGLTGTQLATRGVLQILKFGGKMFAPVRVKTLHAGKDCGSPLKLELDCGTMITAQAVLAATGVQWRKLKAEGAERFERVGVYYACTGVEAQLCDDKPVAVVGGGNSAGQAAVFLAERCPDRDVNLIVRGPALKLSMSEYLCERVDAAPNIRKRFNTVVTAVRGEKCIEEIALRKRNAADGNGNGSAGDALQCAALFVFIGAEPHTDWVPAGVARDSLNYLLTGTDVAKSGKWPVKGRDPCPLETTMPRLLAAGDVRAGSTKRVGFAVGDGALAVTCTHFLRAHRE